MVMSKAKAKLIERIEKQAYVDLGYEDDGSNGNDIFSDIRRGVEAGVLAALKVTKGWTV
jgi:hypothetical protein